MKRISLELSEYEGKSQFKSDLCPFIWRGKVGTFEQLKN